MHAYPIVAAKKIKKVTTSGVRMSLKCVAYIVIGKQNNKLGSLYDSCRIAISHELFSNPRFKMI